VLLAEVVVDCSLVSGWLVCCEAAFDDTFTVEGTTGEDDDDEAELVDLVLVLGDFVASGCFGFWTI
jgi:hypothetical protein